MVVLEYVGLASFGAAIVTALMASDIPQRVASTLQEIISRVAG